MCTQSSGARLAVPTGQRIREETDKVVKIIESKNWFISNTFHRPALQIAGLTLDSLKIWIPKFEF